jgi:hypothetical protein
MTKLQRNHRQNLLQVLRLIASREAQVQFQLAVPGVPVTVELFCKWDACYSPRYKPWFPEAFSTFEIAALDAFQRVVQPIYLELKSELKYWRPPLEEFMATPQWKRLASGAETALQALEKYGNDPDAV